MENHSKLLMNALKKIPGFSKVMFVMLYGSHADNTQNKLSDIDYAIFYNGNKKERFRFRLKILSRLPDKFDIQIFQDLPLFVRKDILKGNLLYAKDESYVYDIAYETMKDFEHFKKYYYDYIGMEAIS